MVKSGNRKTADQLSHWRCESSLFSQWPIVNCLPPSFCSSTFPPRCFYYSLSPLWDVLSVLVGFVCLNFQVGKTYLLFLFSEDNKMGLFFVFKGIMKWVNLSVKKFLTLLFENLKVWKVLKCGISYNKNVNFSQILFILKIWIWNYFF